MADFIFVAGQADLASLQPEDDPTVFFSCYRMGSVDSPARMQLYSLLTGNFLDDCLPFEKPDRELEDLGFDICCLPEEITNRIAQLDEQGLKLIRDEWMVCEEIESTSIDEDELLEFLFLLNSLSLDALNNDNSGLCILTIDPEEF